MTRYLRFCNKNIYKSDMFTFTAFSVSQLLSQSEQFYLKCRLCDWRINFVSYCRLSFSCLSVILSAYLLVWMLIPLFVNNLVPMNSLFLFIRGMWTGELVTKCYTFLRAICTYTYEHPRVDQYKSVLWIHLTLIRIHLDLDLSSEISYVQKPFNVKIKFLRFI